MWSSFLNSCNCCLVPICLLLSLKLSLREYASKKWIFKIFDTLTFNDICGAWRLSPRILSKHPIHSGSTSHQHTFLAYCSWDQSGTSSEGEGAGEKKTKPEPKIKITGVWRKLNNRMGWIIHIYRSYFILSRYFWPLTNTCIYMYVYICTHMQVYIFIYVYVCVCMYAFV